MRKIKPIPNVGFVYILIKDRDVIYIGATRNLEKRIADHKTKDYDFYVAMRVAGYWGVERELIQFHKPKLNILSKINHKTGLPLKNNTRIVLLKENRVRAERKFGKLVVAINNEKEPA